MNRRDGAAGDGSRQPSQHGRNRNHRQVGRGQLLVPCRDPSALLDPLEEVFNVMALLVDGPIVPTLDSPGRIRGDDDPAALPLELLPKGGRIVCAIPDHVRVIEPSKQSARCFHLVGLARGQGQSDRASNGVDDSVNLSGRSATRAPN
jgi:hypothetical protein